MRRGLSNPPKINTGQSSLPPSTPSQPSTPSPQLPSKLYFRGGLASELGGVPSSSSQLLHSGPVVGKGVNDPATQRVIPPAEQEQSRNTRGPYYDRGELWLDVFDQYEGWKRINLSDYTATGNNVAGGSGVYEAPEHFVVTVDNATVFNLAKTPLQYSETVSLNGVDLRYGSSNDYTLQGNSVVVNPAWELRIGDLISVRYATEE